MTDFDDTVGEGGSAVAGLPAAAELPVRWLSMTKLAAELGVTKQTVSERVKRLKLELRPGKGREKLVDAAAYVRAAAETGDPAKQLALDTKEHLEPQAHGGALLRREAAEPQDPGYRDAATREKLAKAQIAELELDERLGKLIPIAEVEDAMVACARMINGEIDRQVLRADEMVAAVGKDGVIGARRVIKQMGVALRTALAEAMALRAADSARVEQTASAPAAPREAGEEERVAA